jgi:hypothetical protein
MSPVAANELIGYPAVNTLSKHYIENGNEKSLLLFWHDWVHRLSSSQYIVQTLYREWK